jgi:lecithin-cholesterol acyltransferase
VRDLFPPYLLCLLDYLTVRLDDATGGLRSQDGTNVTTVDFGLIAGIRGIGPDPLGHFLPVNYECYIRGFLARGYAVGGDLFSAPYDWRFGLDQPGAYFDALRGLVERAAAANGGARVALLSHGMGCALAHLFLTERTTAAWRARFVDSATYVAPSWTGSGQSLFALWRRRFPYIPLRFAALARFVASIGAFHAQLPNAVAFANATLLVDPDGRNHTGAGLLAFLRARARLTPAQLAVAERNFRFVGALPATPDFRVNILYNSGVPTPMGLRLRSWTDVGTPIYGRGDSLVGSKVVDWACAAWKRQGADVLCRDLESADKRYHHRYILKTPEIANLITKWIIGGAENVGDEFDREL